MKTREQLLRIVNDQKSSDLERDLARVAAASVR